MEINQQIQDYIDSVDESKRKDLAELHQLFLTLKPNSKLWFLDGKNDQEKVISNPNIGYGICNLKYANGSIREFYKIGLSANKSGISVYIMGIKDKNILKNLLAPKIGKALISSYCIKFKSLKDINVDILEEALLFFFNKDDE